MPGAGDDEPRLVNEPVGAALHEMVRGALTEQRVAASEHTEFYLINLWNEAFVNSEYGYASALAWVLVLAAAAVILVIFRTSGRWVYYEYDPERER